MKYIKDLILYLKNKEDINKFVGWGFKEGYIHLDAEDLMGFKNWRTRLNIWKMS